MWEKVEFNAGIGSGCEGTSGQETKHQRSMTKPKDQRSKTEDQRSSGHGAGGVRVAAGEAVVRADLLRPDHLQ